MRKAVLRFGGLLIIGLLLAAMIPAFSSVAFSDSKPTVVTTIYPLYEFARQVFGQRAEVVLLTPPGVEPHDWEPGPADLVKVKKAKLFIYNGAGMEPWVEPIKNTVLAGKNVVNVSEAVALIAAAEEDVGHEEDSHGHGHDHGHLDPHIWLDPINAQDITGRIAQAAKEIDPANAARYEANAQSYIAQLAALHAEYITAFNQTSRRELITTHAAFGYLAKRYGLVQEAIMGLEPDAEPSPEKMTQIIRYIKARNIKYIFAETLLSPKLAQTIASETGVKVLVLNPLEGLTDQEVAQGKTYLSVMRENLSHLKQALQ